MNARLLPWAAFAVVVAVLALGTTVPGDGVPAPAVSPGTDAGGPEVRMGPVEMREFHDDGTWNRLDAREAVYSYARKTVKGSEVVVSLGTGGNFKRSVIRAPMAFWDFNSRSVSLPEGGVADREGGWKGDLSPAALDLAGGILRVPGPVSLSGPGFSVAGTNLVWRWPDGKVTLDSPVSLIAPAALPGREG
jgi:hypothetical protein